MTIGLTTIFAALLFSVEQRLDDDDDDDVVVVVTGDPLFFFLCLAPNSSLIESSSSSYSTRFFLVGDWMVDLFLPHWVRVVCSIRTSIVDSNLRGVVRTREMSSLSFVIIVCLTVLISY